MIKLKFKLFHGLKEEIYIRKCAFDLQITINLRILKTNQNLLSEKATKTLHYNTVEFQIITPCLKNNTFTPEL